MDPCICEFFYHFWLVFVKSPFWFREITGKCKLQRLEWILPEFLKTYRITRYTSIFQVVKFWLSRWDEMKFLVLFCSLFTKIFESKQMLRTRAIVNHLDLALCEGKVARILGHASLNFSVFPQKTTTTLGKLGKRINTRFWSDYFLNFLRNEFKGKNFK